MSACLACGAPSFGVAPCCAAPCLAAASEIPYKDLADDYVRVRAERDAALARCAELDAALADAARCREALTELVTTCDAGPARHDGVLGLDWDSAPDTNSAGRAWALAHAALSDTTGTEGLRALKLRVAEAVREACAKAIRADRAEGESAADVAWRRGDIRALGLAAIVAGVR